MAKAKKYDVAIIGLGSAGLTAASTAAKLGLRVLAVERGRAGGDCLWGGCIPSKTLLASARVAAIARDAKRFGVTTGEVEVDPKAVWRRIHEVQEQIAMTDDNIEHYIEMGVDVREGPARLVGSRAIEVGGERFPARKIIIATGSRPALPGIDGIEAVDPLTTDTLWDLSAPPAEITILGAGPAGVEIAQGLQRIGSKVTLIHRHERILPRHDPALALLLMERLAEDGVRLIGEAEIEQVQQVESGSTMLTGLVAGEERSFETERLLVCCGRLPNFESLDIEGVGIDHGDLGILTDERLRTSAKSVYAVGDVAGRGNTHTAGFDGAMAVRDIAFPGAGRRAAGVPDVVFTDPELATAGLTFAQALERYPRRRVERIERDLAGSDRARTDGDPPGRVVLVSAGGRLVGAQLLAPAAGEAVGGFEAAVKARTKIPKLAERIEAYPTRALEFQRAAGDRSLERAARIRSWLPRIPFR